MLDRDAAGFVEQLLPVADSHNSGIDSTQHRVDAGQPPDLFLLVDMFEREGDVACDFRHQLHLVLVEEPDLRGVQAENAESCAIDDQRDHRERPESALRAFLAETGALVVEHVVGYGRGSVADSTPGHAEAFAVLAGRESDDPEQALLRTAERDRQYFLSPRIDDAD